MMENAERVRAVPQDLGEYQFYALFVRGMTGEN